MERIVECVPNFSEGRDMGLIRQITSEIESVEGVSLLNVDPGGDVLPALAGDRDTAAW